MSVIGIIPARYASTRFPGKPLVDIGGKTMIQRVYEQASKAKLDQVLVATDDQRIFDHVQEFAGKVVMTKEGHPSGTDRCFEAYCLNDEPHEFVVNVQGDEPFIKPEQINQLVEALQLPGTQLATLALQIVEPELLPSPNVVKVVMNAFHEAMYFSRHPIPYVRGTENHNEWIMQH